VASNNEKEVDYPITWFERRLIQRAIEWRRGVLTDRATALKSAIDDVLWERGELDR
jgi:hypothetical protein